jgi:hypothetical protein
MSKSWNVEVEQAPDGEYFIQLSDDMLEESGFAIGDEIEWIDQGDGSWMLKKVEPKKVWVMVEAVSQFRMRYMVEVPATNPEWAMDTVVMNEAKEFSQEHLGETIVSHRVMTEAEALELCDIDNDYTKSWNTEQKINAFFTKDGEEVKY